MNTDTHRSTLLVRKIANQIAAGGFAPLSVSIWVHLWLISLFLTAFPHESSAQIRPVYDQGALGLAQLLKRLNTTASALMIGAHPDDEDTALLAYLARGESARTAYLSLTRGDGGQNIIGPELGEALGVIRTEELLQARKLDGAEQYFTRAYDYGFSKTLAEAKQKWDEKIILCDVVRVIRDFRPLVVISQFTGTPADGHGQHQFAGYISPLAVKAAADPAQCTENGPAWQVKKFYVRHGFRATGEPKLRINTGKYDPLLGRSYFEIAMEARSQHKSQEQGVLELKGEAFSGLNGVGIESKETGVFDSLDTTVRGAAINTGESSPRFVELLGHLQDVTGRASSEYDLRAPEKLIALLIEGHKLAYDAEWSIRSPAPKAFARQKQVEFLAALKLAAGIQLDALSDKETVTPGETFNVTARVFYPRNPAIAVKNVTVKTPMGWTVSTAEAPAAVQGQSPLGRRENPNFISLSSVKVAEAAVPTLPYWLRKPRQGDMFAWNGEAVETLSLQAPEITAEIKLTVSGSEITFSQPVEYRFADDVRGEIRRPLEVVPAVSLLLDQDLIVIPRSGRELSRELTVTIINNSTSSIAGTVIVDPPIKSLIRPESPRFSLARKGERVSLPFTIITNANTPIGKAPVIARAVIDSQSYADSMQTIEYPHIQTHRTYGTSMATVNLIDLAVAPVKVGYIVGSGDKVPQAITQIGADLTVIDERTLASGDLSRFDVIVVGIRAYQVRPDVVANNKRLLDFASNGGTLIVQYQLPGYSQGALMPYPAQMGPRVSDENAPVMILQPDHPIFNFPNKITNEDFKGWVQERNLYNFSTFDEKYLPLLESHDPGEAENKGGLVIADVGKGKYIYCSYSLFRQLPAGVPGAYRLLANMLSLPKAKK